MRANNGLPNTHQVFLNTVSNGRFSLEVHGVYLEFSYQQGYGGGDDLREEGNPPKTGDHH